MAVTFKSFLCFAEVKRQNSESSEVPSGRLPEFQDPGPCRPVPVSSSGTSGYTWALSRLRGGAGTEPRLEGEAHPAFGAPMAPRAPRPDADVSFPSHYTSRHHLLRFPRKSRLKTIPSPQISSFSASWSSAPVLGPKGGVS